MNSGPGYETGTHGTHSSTGAGAYGTGAGTGNTYGSSTGSGLGGHSSGTHTGSDAYGSSNTGNYGSGNINAGPHDSKLANKADPRVDSDRGE